MAKNRLCNNKFDIHKSDKISNNEDLNIDQIDINNLKVKI